MKFTTGASAGELPETIEDATNSCCMRRAEMEWSTEDIVLAASDGRALPTDAIDRLPPWRAVVYVRFAMRLPGTRMQDGDLEQLLAAARKVGGYAQPGWWRAELGLEPQEPRAGSAPHTPRTYVAPTGWQVVRRPTNTGPH
jgi:hypothetical protein